MTKLYVVQEQYEGGIFGAFTKQGDADAFKAACDAVSSDDNCVTDVVVDLPWQCAPVVGFEVHHMEGGDEREAAREIVGSHGDFVALQEHGYHHGKLFARACRPTEAEARAAIAELITAKRAEIEAGK